MSDRKFADRLADYVEVKDRIGLFLTAHPEGRLVTLSVKATSEPDGKPRVWVEAAAYRTPDDPLPGRGWSWMELPGTTTYTRGSELENTETSAWGRAIAACGIGLSKSIASRDEVVAKERDAQTQAADAAFDAGLVGTAEIGKGDADFELRQEPTHGWKLAFRLVEGRKGIKVIALGSLAEMVHEYRKGIEGYRVTCWGTIEEKSFPKKLPNGQTQTIKYEELRLSRLKVGAVELAEPEEPEAEPEQTERLPVAS